MKTEQGTQVEETPILPPQEGESKECEVCKINPSKYTCPGCTIRFCSVQCSKVHKENTKCTGQRNKAKMIDLKKFTNSDVISDYQYLEESQDVVENANRYRTKHRVYDIETQDSVLFIQKRALYKNVLMRLMPEGMYKRRKNTTHYINKNDLLCWKIEYQFGQKKVEEKSVSETETVKNSILKILNDPITKQGLENFVVASQEDPIGFNVYMKVENYPGEFYYKLDIVTTISNQLRYREVIEYPVFLVVLKNEDQPKVIGTEDEAKHKDFVRKETGNVFRDLPRSFSKNDKPDHHHHHSDRGGSSRGGYRSRGSYPTRGQSRGSRGGRFTTNDRDRPVDSHRDAKKPKLDDKE